MKHLLALTLTVLSGTAAADELGPGFSSSLTPYPVGGAIRNLANGSLVTCDGLLVQRWFPSGAFAGTIGSFSSPGQTGAMEIDPSETFVVVGNSVSGEMIKVQLDGSGQTTLATIPSNRDITFMSGTNAIVSAAICGTGCGSALVQLNTNTGATSNLVAVEGASGPVALDNALDLYYGTLSASIPPAAGSSSILKFSSADLQNPPAPVFQVDEGLVVIEIESVPPVGSWTEATVFPGFTGTSYYRWDGPDLFGTPGVDVLHYEFEVIENGNYEFHYHNRHDDPLPDQDNDSWVRVDDGPWLKIFSNQGAATVGVWNWHSIVDEAGGAQYQANYDLTPGRHVIEISGRSNGFKIDRMVFFRSYVSNPLDLANPESIFASYNQSIAQTIATGFDGATEMVHEPERDVLLFAENNSGTGTNRILDVAKDGGFQVRVNGDPGNTLRNLDFTEQPGSGIFFSFQPPGNGALGYTRTDFSTINQRRALLPKRPTLTLTGPGTVTGVGLVNLTVGGAYPGGSVFFAWAPAGMVSPVESPILIGGLPLVHTGMPPTLTQLPGGLSCDSTGKATLSFMNTLGAPGVIGLQGLVIDTHGKIAGSTKQGFL